MSEEFSTRLSSEQDRRLAAMGLEDRVRARLLSGARPARRHDQVWRLPAAFAVGGLAAAAALVLVLGSGSDQLNARNGTDTVAVGQWIEADEAPARIDFSDGTVVVLEPGSTARLAKLDGHGATLLVERGVADLDVVHTGHAAWTVRAGPYTVEVTGTAFELGWLPESEEFHVHMREGSVEIVGPASEDRRRITGTDRFTSPGRMVVVTEQEAKEEVPSGAVPVAAPVQPAAPAPPDVGTAEESVDWHAAYVERNYSRAVESARAQGLGSVIARESAVRLYALGDAAKLSGETELASRVWLAVRERFPGTEKAAAAAWELGRAVESSSSVESVRWYRAAASESSHPTTAQLALGRMMVVLDSSGDPKAAKQAAIEYLEKYPAGTHAEQAKALAPRHKR